MKKFVLVLSLLSIMLFIQTLSSVYASNAVKIIDGNTIVIDNGKIRADIQKSDGGVINNLYDPSNIGWIGASGWMDIYNIFNVAFGGSTCVVEINTPILGRIRCYRGMYNATFQIYSDSEFIDYAFTSGTNNDLYYMGNVFFNCRRIWR